MNSRIASWPGLVLCLLVVASCGEGVQPAATSPFDSPVLAPTGSVPSSRPLDGSDVILFTSNRDGVSAYYLMRRDGSAVQRLLFPNVPAEVHTPTWSAALQRFVFVGRTNGDEDVYLANWERTEYKNLTDNPDLVESVPVVSPNGRWIALVCTWSDPDICLIGSDGADPKQVTGAPAWDADPVWSADSQRLAYVSNAQGISDLYVVSISGSEPVKLTSDKGRHSSPSWSPDGAMIAYQADTDGAWDVWLVAPDGSEPTNLTHSPSADQAPIWSPDGKLIAFRSDRDGNAEIYVVGADGQNPRNVSQSPNGNENVFAWSPDSQQLVFVSDVEGNLDIFRVNVDGSDKVNLTNNPADDGAPIWFVAP